MSDLEQTRAINLEQLHKAEANRYVRYKLPVVILLILILLAGSQAAGGYIYKGGLKKLEAKLTGLDRDYRQTIQTGRPSLVQELASLESLARRTEELAREREALRKKCWFVIPALLADRMDNRLALLQQELKEFNNPSKKLKSLIQQMKQGDRELATISGDMSFQSAIDKISQLMGDNDAIKNDLTKLVVPAPLKRYQDDFIAALTERGQAMIAMKDYLRAEMLAGINLDMAVKTYRSAWFDWEYAQSEEYATEAGVFARQAEGHKNAVADYLQRYMELRAKVTGSYKLIDSDLGKTGVTPPANATAPQNVDYLTYTNPRYGFSLVYPGDFLPSDPPENGDGREFVSRDGTATLTGSGSNNVTGSSLDDEYNRWQSQAGEDIKYKAKLENSFVLSWEESDLIKYVRVFWGPGSINTLLFSYPKAKRDYYDDICTRVSTSFRPGNLDEAH